MLRCREESSLRTSEPRHICTPRRSAAGCPVWRSRPATPCIAPSPGAGARTPAGSPRSSPAVLSQLSELGARCKDYHALHLQPASLCTAPTPGAGACTPAGSPHSSPALLRWLSAKHQRLSNCQIYATALSLHVMPHPGARSTCLRRDAVILWEREDRTLRM